MRHEAFVSAASPDVTRHSLVFGTQKINLHESGHVIPPSPNPHPHLPLTRSRSSSPKPSVSSLAPAISVSSPKTQSQK